MNNDTIEIFGKVDFFNEFKGSPIKTLKDLPKLRDEYIRTENSEMAQFIDEWITSLNYYIAREHDDSDEFFL